MFKIMISIVDLTIYIIVSWIQKLNIASPVQTFSLHNILQNWRGEKRENMVSQEFRIQVATHFRSMYNTWKFVDKLCIVDSRRKR